MRPRSRRRRVAVAVSVGVGVLVVVGVAGALRGEGPEPAGNAPQAPAEPSKPPELPRGGRSIFPHYRVVALYGSPQDPQLGTLGVGTPAQGARRLLERAKDYRRGGRPVLPALELIATVAAGDAGADGNYNFRQSGRVIRRYLRAARRVDALLLLDIQPGHASFIEEVERYERYLREPDVGLALDPEWSMHNGQTPGSAIGWTDASTVNRISERLAELVGRHELPEKLLVVHQFTEDMVRDKDRLQRRPGVELVLNVDGFGDQANKASKYRQLTRGQRGFANGFKLFHREDTSLMSPRQVLRLRPPPDLVIYE